MIFIFDLDGTITTQETLPLIAAEFSLSSQIDPLTEATIKGNIPFIESFINRVRILSSIDATKISKLLSEVELNKDIIQFISENPTNCVVATGNFRGWLTDVSQKIPCEIFASEGIIDSHEGVKLSKILLKEDLVKKYKEEGEFVVYIGDGHNDAEAMRLSDVAIACGLVHEPANSVIEICDYLIYESSALVRLLNQIKSPQIGKSIVISSAGVGSRLGMGQTKSLIHINNKSLIHYQLEWFSAYQDIRIVVGFQAQKLISEVLSFRKDIIFVFNHNYFHNKTGTSLYLGARHANEWVLAWDGDLLIHPSEVRSCVEASEEYVGISLQSTEDGVFVNVDKHNMVTNFTKERNKYEWSGPALLKKSNIRLNNGHVYEVLQPALPIKAQIVDALDIDTYSDYVRAVEFVNSWNKGNAKIHSFYEKMANEIKDAKTTRNKSFDFSEYDVNFVKKYASQQKGLLDLGAGTGLLINNLTNDFSRIVAVERNEGLTRFIQRAPNVEVIVDDILCFQTNEKFDVITVFGVMNFFNEVEAIKIYLKIKSFIKATGVFIVKHQMGIHQNVVVDGFSEELQENYFSEYRKHTREIELISNLGFDVIEVVDIYPSEFNRWENTHFYALVCKPST
jgi:HAD superfamily phosphoserine phosphatase-like hydrolase